MVSLAAATAAATVAAKYMQQERMEGQESSRLFLCVCRCVCESERERVRQMGEGTSACPQGCLIHVLAYSNSQMRGYATGQELTDVQRRLMRICLDNNATSNSIRQEEPGG